MNNDLKETVLTIEKEISSITTESFEIEFSKDSKQVAVYMVGYVAKKIKCYVCNNKIILNDSHVKNDEHLKTLSRGGVIVACTTFKDFVCQTCRNITTCFTEINLVATVSNTVVIKLECGYADFSCEQHFKNSKKSPYGQS